MLSGRSFRRVVRVRSFGQDEQSMTVAIAGSACMAKGQMQRRLGRRMAGCCGTVFEKANHKRQTTVASQLPFNCLSIASQGRMAGLFASVGRTHVHFVLGRKRRETWSMVTFPPIRKLSFSSQTRKKTGRMGPVILSVRSSRTWFLWNS